MGSDIKVNKERKRGGHPLPKLEPTYGRYTVLGIENEGPPHFKRMARVRCACGNERLVRARQLITGETRSCGCLAYELKTKHGEAGNKHKTGRDGRSDEYKAWTRTKWYYKWAGLEMPPMLATFASFLKAAGRRPSPEFFFNVHSLSWLHQLRYQRAYEWAIEASPDEQAAAEAWLKDHAADVEPVLPYMLDRPIFICYDEQAGFNSTLPPGVINQIPFHPPGCYRKSIPIKDESNVLL